MTVLGTPAIRHWTVPRDRTRPDSNEDAFRAEIVPDHNGWTAFLALADGAGSTLFAGNWARALVDAAEPGWVGDGLSGGVDGVRRSFDPLADRDANFMLEQKWRQIGSASTFLATVVRSTSAGAHLRAAGVGDSLLLISESAALTTFPLVSSSQFSNRTATIRTHRSEIERKDWQGVLKPGSMVVLASDAVGKWLLRQSEDHGVSSVHEWLLQADTSSLPAVDDDLTLVILDLPLERGRTGRSGWPFRRTPRL